VTTLQQQVDSVFHPEGILAQRLENFEYRLPQHRYANAVYTSIMEKKSLLIEGATGVGKSLAYLVPAIFHAKNTKKRVVIATANIALQEQLHTKDLPFLKKHLPIDFAFGLVKGRGNYLCRRRLKNMLTNYEYIKGDIEEEIENWAEYTDTGDRSELENEPSPGVWGLYSCSAEECVNCSAYKNTCFAKLARSKLGTYDVIVCNYHLLLSHAVVRAETESGGVLPDFDLLVCDEGHKLADIARSFFGWEISQFTFNRLRKLYFRSLTAIRKVDGVESLLRAEETSVKELKKAGEDLEDSEKAFFSDVEVFFKAGKPPAPRRFAAPTLIQVQDLMNSLLTVAQGFKILAAALGVAKKVDDRAECHKAKSRCRKIATQLEELYKIVDKNAVYYVETAGKRQFLRVVKRMIDVSELLDTHVYDHTDSSVVTSATLAVSGSFAYLQSEIGLRGALGVVVESPFDYTRQGLLVISGNAPDPKAKDQKKYLSEVCDDLEFIISEARGRTLGLFTSYRSLKAASEHLKPKLGRDYTIFVQGDAPRTRLVEKFREDTSSVLLGTESFWAGVDVPGEALSCLVIDKIPFKSPGDPVWDERCRRDEKWFWNLALPAAVIQLKQGIGRLIRSKTDYGVVVILDNRMIAKNYGSLIARALPPMPRAVSTGAIRAFLDKGLA